MNLPAYEVIASLSAYRREAARRKAHAKLWQWGRTAALVLFGVAWALGCIYVDWYKRRGQ
jgi:hypothetical protein